MTNLSGAIKIVICTQYADRYIKEINVKIAMEKQFLIKIKSLMHIKIKSCINAEGSENEKASCTIASISNSRLFMISLLGMMIS